MEAPGIVEGFDIINEHGLGFGAVFRDFVVEAFGFERSEKTLRCRVIVTAGLAAHAGQNVVGFEQFSEVLRSVLDATIGMMRCLS